MGLRSQIAFFVRQFPFIYPRTIVRSCKGWIDSQGKAKGVYFSQRGPWYKTIFPAEFIQNKAPQTVGDPNEGAFYNNRSYPIPEANLFYLQNSYVFGQRGLILSARHEVFQEFTHNFNVSTLRKFLLKNPFYTFTTKAEKKTGVGAVLLSPESHNYYHWLGDVLPRIRLYEEVLDQVDHFCIASNVPAKFLAVLKDFGIPDEKITLIKKNEKLHFDHLYVSSLPGSEGRSPAWAVNYVREKLLNVSPSTSPAKKVYFKRGPDAGRKLINEEAIISLLQNKGFEITDPGGLGIYEQAALMQDTKMIVAAHGAALTNLLFSRDGAAVIELFSPDYFRTDCYYTLSCIRNLNYWYIVGTKPAGAGWGDMIADEELLLNTIEKIHA